MESMIYIKEESGKTMEIEYEILVGSLGFK